MKWISIKDGNFPHEKSFLVTDGCEHFVAWKKNGDDKFYYSYCCGCRVENVTHWMELPEMPNEKNT